jgi:hypothetical protein
MGGYVRAGGRSDVVGQLRVRSEVAQTSVSHPGLMNRASKLEVRLQPGARGGDWSDPKPTPDFASVLTVEDLSLTAGKSTGRVRCVC